MQKPERKTFIFVRSRFVAFHRWIHAPKDVEFLRNYHRHVFHVKVTAEVKGHDREIEFFQFQMKLNHFLKRHEGGHFDKSCEMIAHEILDQFPELCACEVSEDGENGAFVTTAI